MRKIKFRAKGRNSGNFHYGDLIHVDKEIVKIREEYAPGAYRSVEVFPNTVAQYVGTDAEGNELYEGDKGAGRLEAVRRDSCRAKPLPTVHGAPAGRRERFTRGQEAADRD